jgi:hypothetical protein
MPQSLKHQRLVRHYRDYRLFFSFVRQLISISPIVILRRRYIKSLD